LSREGRWAVRRTLIVAAGVLWAFRPSDHVTEETYQQILLGMSLEEVEQIMGVPAMEPGEFADSYRRRANAGEIKLTNRVQEARPVKAESKTMVWTGNRGGIAIGLDENGIVIRKWYQGWQQPSFLSRLRARLGL
jgi:hypothetical protein